MVSEFSPERLNSETGDNHEKARISNYSEHHGSWSIRGGACASTVRRGLGLICIKRGRQRRNDRGG